jgi:hypothetical protein
MQRWPPLFVARRHQDGLLHLIDRSAGVSMAGLGQNGRIVRFEGIICHGIASIILDHGLVTVVTGCVK